MKVYPLLLLLLGVAPLQAQQKKIYLANDDHTDYLWTGDEATYRRAFSEMLDYYIRLNDSTAHLPYHQQSKWNCDGSYWVYNYRLTRSPAQFAKLIEQIRQGKITVAMNSMIVMMGVAPAEATLRDLYYAGSLKRRYGLDFNLALSMEDQALSLGLSSLWAGSGVKYSWRGVCACATRVTGLENRRNHVYWYRGLDDQRVLMKWYAVNPSMITNRKAYRYNLGNYLEASHPVNAIVDCKALMNDPVYPFGLAAAFGKGGDDLKTLTDAFVRVAKEQSDSTCQVVVSNEVDFFREFETRYGRDLPAETQSSGTEWGNNVASLAEVSAGMKRAVEKLRAAEALYTLVALKDNDFASDLVEQREKAWLAAGMYYEHDWTADGPHVTRKQRADWQRQTAARFGGYVDALYGRSAARLGQLIRKTGRAERFYAFNPLGWARDDYADYSYDGPLNIRVVDLASGESVPFQRIQKAGRPYLRVLARNLPSLGYKTFEIRPQVRVPASPPGVQVSDTTLENRFYRLRFTRQGVITSLWDKRRQREVVRPSDGLYLNDLGSGKGSVGDTVRVENQGAVSATVRVFSYKPLKHTSRITLFADLDRIDIQNVLEQNVDAKPVTYSFSFNLDRPDTWHEEAGAVLLAKPLSRGGHYADSVNRVDWLTLNHFADMSDANGGVILSNRDAYFMRPGKSHLNRLDDTTARLNVLATGQIDPNLGIVNQDGDSHFEHFFALKPHAGPFPAAEAMRFALEHQNPPVTGRISGGTAYPETQFSLLRVSDPDLLTWTVKPSEEGIEKGVVLRLWNQSARNQPCTITTTAPLAKAYATTHVETDDRELPLTNAQLKTDVGHHRMQTFRLVLNPSPATNSR